MAEDSESAASQQSLELDDQDTCGIDGDNEEETEHAKGSPAGDLGAKKKKKKQKRKKEKPNSGGTKSDSASDSQEIKIQPPSKNPTIPMQKLQDIQRAMELLSACQGPARNIDEATKRRYQFWDTQPVPKLNEVITSHGAIEPDKDNVRQEPYSLPQGFMWDTLDLSNAEVLKELYTLLNENYVEDDDNMFRFDYSPEFLLCVKKMVEINFLCVHKKLRSKRVAPVLIREITRRVNLEGIFQAVYTAGVVLPKPVATCRYWHRSLNPRKLVEVKFSHLSRNMTLQRTMKLYRLPDVTKTSGLRPMEPKDIKAVRELINTYLKQFHLAPVMDEEEVAHWFLPQEHIIDTFVVEVKIRSHRITADVQVSLWILSTFNQTSLLIPACLAQARPILDFDRATEDVRKLKTRPEDEELKELYGLYKQAVIGDIDIGLSKENAMNAYISKAKDLIEKYGI
ncbi:Glycylpeptide N-tetradecanoyltransferase 2 [Sciurus carolinensis]|uniref:Glycylpeptide N-tetradecanoyltransferase n=1 Tax=Sciurus carolinensis TaxID=30640 RepID=A0AA41MLL0_SCICA|nr:Glycylpeptide N-tetradecanoyltransferase 2 [Sciurus carolinensis]